MQPFVKHCICPEKGTSKLLDLSNSLLVDDCKCFKVEGGAEREDKILA